MDNSKSSARTSEKMGVATGMDGIIIVTIIVRFNVDLM